MNSSFIRWLISINCCLRSEANNFKNVPFQGGQAHGAQDILVNHLIKEPWYVFLKVLFDDLRRVGSVFQSRPATYLNVPEAEVASAVRYDKRRKTGSNLVEDDPKISIWMD